METELKLLLVSAAELHAVELACGPIARTLGQDNLYFDDAHGAWRAAGWSVRLRDEREGASVRHLLTVKGPTPQPESSPFVRREEWERWLDGPTATGLREGRHALGAAVRELLRAASAPPLPPALDPEALVPLGSLRNVRSAVVLPGDGPELTLELDTTSYPDGTTGWEVELEVSDGADAAEQDAAVTRLRSVLHRAGVPWRPSTVTKLARFHAALRELR